MESVAIRIDRKMTVGERLLNAWAKMRLAMGCTDTAFMDAAAGIFRERKLDDGKWHEMECRYAEFPYRFRTKDGKVEAAGGDFEDDPSPEDIFHALTEGIHRDAIEAASEDYRLHASIYASLVTLSGRPKKAGPKGYEPGGPAVTPRITDALLKSALAFNEFESARDSDVFRYLQENNVPPAELVAVPSPEDADEVLAYVWHDEQEATFGVMEGHLPDSETLYAALCGMDRATLFRTLESAFRKLPKTIRLEVKYG